MVRLRANGLNNYNQRRLKRGDKFSATKEDARILLLTGLVEHDEDDSEETEVERPKRHYRRRDLTAE